MPLSNPAAYEELDVQPRLSYRTDPDGRIEWCERGFDFGF